VVAVLAGVLLVVAAAGITIKTRVKLVARLSSWVVLGVSRSAAEISTAATTFARRHQRLGYAVLGLANGLFPCGLVYAAVVTAAAAGTIVHAVLFMIGFGAGTVPLLMALTVSASTIPAGVRRRFRLAFPAVLALAGILLIARGVVTTDRNAAGPALSSILSHRH
jgi:sulfite exporter TauE/SafE